MDMIDHKTETIISLILKINLIKMERSDEWGMNHLPKDLVTKLALELDLPSILNYCRSSKKFNIYLLKYKI